MNDRDSRDSGPAARAAAVEEGAFVVVALGRSDVGPEAAVLLTRTSKASRVGGGMERLAVNSFPQKPSSCSGR